MSEAIVFERRRDVFTSVHIVPRTLFDLFFGTGFRSAANSPTIHRRSFPVSSVGPASRSFGQHKISAIDIISTTDRCRAGLRKINADKESAGG